MRRQVTNEILLNTISSLRKQYKNTKSKIWLYAAELLSRPKRRRIAVNLNKINRFANDNDVILIPGKVLGEGRINKKVTIIAFSFSKEAIEKIRSSGGNYITIEEALKTYPEGKSIKILI
ncbi:ribosomal protein L18E [Caldisphaera lagunensis DSM 15908]|uniref:Large ribosomal subunit protein eL18 n=1 Tax=Caldisphaera lagunensis (strain DSM 15908 / JCM 11604 / ANMR 0165 / IC-154) TaxID=1056495 RepID=L0AB02_CALLD|nr:50S ribosomal protein L18e [Caldisphaera lagunensis]AFZ70312.1 ribosomal protein L18E [Caldisphaera lagunensis DSM 15908]